ncbi:MAG TPA: hypothetical protein DCS83_07420 [Prevotella sp.]|nr:hypothetical protein [Prevotella sp.]
MKSSGLTILVKTEDYTNKAMSMLPPLDNPDKKKVKSRPRITYHNVRMYLDFHTNGTSTLVLDDGNRSRLVDFSKIETDKVKKVLKANPVAKQFIREYEGN